MRLLNASTLRLTEFVGDSVPPYAALSHTWVANEELSLQDWEEIHKHPEGSACHPFAQRGGYQKIAWCCDHAKQDGLEWVWVDTCCIDKTSSSELSEAINSMFRWYQNCRVCYTFLSDVSDGDVPQAPDSEFRRCRWFTRGWTLQELLAPECMQFFSKSWALLGDRSELCQAISEVSRIPSDYLRSDNRLPIFAASIAQRMSWAAPRCTTRREDLAYCLLGIFDVNMPLLYGEADKAFQRLQEEIIKHTNDSSCHSIIMDKHGQPVGDFEVTKKGLRISILIEHDPRLISTMDGSETILGLLNCYPSGDVFNVIAIRLTWPESRRNRGSFEFVRERSPPVLWPRHRVRWPTLKTIYIIKPSAPYNTPPAQTVQPAALAATPGSIIIPTTAFFAVEALTSTPPLTVRRPDDMDHYVVADTDLQAPATAKGNAYFRFRLTTITDPSMDIQLDLLVKVVFEVLPRDELPADEPTYPPGRRKLRKRTEQEKKNQRWAASGLSVYVRSDGVQGRINCFLCRTPEAFVRGHDIQGGGAEYLDALTGWEEEIWDGRTTYRPMIRKQQVVGANSNVLLLWDDRMFDREFWAWLAFKLDFEIYIHGKRASSFYRHAARFAVLTLLEILCAFAAASRIGSQDAFGGSIWMALGMTFAALCLSQPRPNYELPMLMLIHLIIIGVVFAIFYSVFGPLGILYFIFTAVYIFLVFAISWLYEFPLDFIKSQINWWSGNTNEDIG
ncbi:heterokaryon incompatibility protein-domain-containing protein [Lasiosphaeria ovina]|uniref:Heterokaryon incompatibility protein-domain-containing protein n=1 Tax=Lasiosphaeria ovina TaxID=92902 RepID=A0AAE0JTP2_9PEZI|nr:heterokaryon incompatibility protein-domain-containing protein [Lasiosphaeria ovina]